MSSSGHLIGVGRHNSSLLVLCYLMGENQSKPLDKHSGITARENGNRVEVVDERRKKEEIREITETESENTETSRERILSGTSSSSGNEGAGFAAGKDTESFKGRESENLAVAERLAGDDPVDVHEGDPEAPIEPSDRNISHPLSLSPGRSLASPSPAPPTHSRPSSPHIHSPWRSTKSSSGSRFHFSPVPLSLSRFGQTGTASY
jgi:hypothetical protein